MERDYDFLETPLSYSIDSIYEDEFNRNELSKNQEEDTSYILSEIQDKFLKNKLSQIQTEYLSNVSNIFSRIIDSYNQLLFTRNFIDYEPDPGLLLDLERNHGEYLAYHMQVFYVKIVTIAEQIVILINAVYNLGIPEKRLSDRTVDENKHTKDTEANQLLKKLLKLIPKEKRNLIVHRGIFKHKSIEDLTTLHFKEEYGNELSYPNIGIEEQLEKTKIECLTEMDTILSETKKILISIFESLDEIFNEKIEHL